MGTQPGLPSRLHHTAYVTNDMEATRKFYEDVIGLPLVATWSESDELFGAVRTYMHCFFGLGDGGALAFFQFEKPEDQALFGPKMPSSPFHHIALNVDAETQKGIEQRLRAAGYEVPDSYVLEHGYCHSVYATDPQWHDRGVHPGRPPGRRDQRRAAQGRPRHPQALARRRPYLQQHLPLTAPPASSLAGRPGPAKKKGGSLARPAQSFRRSCPARRSSSP